MARNDIGQISVIGLEAESIPALADKVQEELIDKWVGRDDLTLNILQQYFWNPSESNKNYGQMIYFSLDEKKKPTEPGTEVDHRGRGSKKR